MGVNPFNHVVLRDIELISPTNDTIALSHTIAVRFKRFPYDSHGLSFSQVRINDTYYHFKTDSTGINLKYIIDSFRSEAHKKKKNVEFKVLVDDLILKDVHYKQDLKERRSHHRNDSVGVDVKHMEFFDIDGRFRNLRVDADRVTCRIDRLTTTERSGLQVQEMHMNVYVTRSGISATNMVLQTADSRLMGDVLLDYWDWRSMKYFLDSVYFTVQFFDGSYGNMKDAAYWAHTLWGMDQKVDISGYFSGPLQDFHADSLKLAFGTESTVDLDACIYGLPNIDTTVISATIHHLHTTYEDLAAVKHPRAVKLKAEKILKELETIDMEGSFAGTIRDFYATIDLKTKPGNVKGDVVLAMDSKRNDFRYVGELMSDGFYVGRLLPNQWVARSGFEVSFEGRGLDPKTMNASVTGRLYHTVLRGHRMTGETAIDVDATDGILTADADLNDDLASFSAHGEIEWRDRGPLYRARLDADHIDLKRLDLWADTSDKEAIVEGVVNGTFVDLGDGNSRLRATLDNLRLVTSRKDCRVNNATVVASEQNGWKNLILKSDVMNAQMRGYYRYSGIGMMISKFVDDVFEKNRIGATAD